MKNQIKTIIKKNIPKSLLSQIDRNRFKREIKTNYLIDIKIRDITIKCPKQHPLVRWNKTQPYRDLSLGISAKFYGKKYSRYKIVDIGANIGDTAAMVASFTDNPMILIEPSNIFYPIAEKNCSYIPHIERLEQCYVMDGSNSRGKLSHRGGTASFEEDFKSNEEIKTKSLSEIADERSKFIKIDTDGYDYSIINSNLDWLSSNQPIIYFENETPTLDLLQLSNQTFENLFSIGYKYFSFWDDKGLLIFSTHNMIDIKRFNYYLHKTLSNHKLQPGIWGSNVLCVSEDDIDILNSVNEYYENY